MAAILYLGQPEIEFDFVEDAVAERFRYLRYGLFLVMVALLTHQETASAVRVEYCSIECGAEESCNTACIDDLMSLTTCLEYDGGPSNGQCAGVICSEVCSLNEDCGLPCYDGGNPYFESDCDEYNGGECENSCDVICNPYSSSCGTACTDSGGGSTTCGNYGVCLTCGDDICAGNAGETCGNCSADCECPSTGMPGSMIAAIPSNPTFSETTTLDLCEQATTHGFGDQWDCPSWSAINNFNIQHASCDAKWEVQADVWYGNNFYRWMVKSLTIAGDCGGGAHNQSICDLRDEYNEVLTEGEAYYAQILATPCYLFS